MISFGARAAPVAADGFTISSGDARHQLTNVQIKGLFVYSRGPLEIGRKYMVLKRPSGIASSHDPSD